jgi:hypothetical protein
LQNGVATIPVLVASVIEPAAIEFAKTQLIKKFSAFAWPVLVDLNSRTLLPQEDRVVVGGIYAAWITPANQRRS